jgi:predicted molibdopterin-dependent oxidoreductase YjgC
LLNDSYALLSRLQERFGSAGSTNSIWDLETANSVLVVAGNPTEEQNVLAVPAKKAVREGAKLVVIDARETELTRYATEWLRPIPGSEALVVAGITRAIIDEALEDKDFVSSRVTNAEEIKQSQIRRAARVFAEGQKGAVLVGDDGLSESTVEVLADAVVDLTAITGNLGDNGAGVFPLYNGANTLGAHVLGLGPAGENRSRDQIIDSMTTGGVKAALVFADGISSGTPGLERLPLALGNVDFVAVSAVFDSEITAHADVVLPAVTYAEQNSTMTNLERRVQLVRKTAEPRHEEKTGWETAQSVAGALGNAGVATGTASEVFAEIAKSVGSMSGMSHESLRSGDNKFGQVSDNETLFSDESEQISLQPLVFEELAEGISSDELLFAPGRVLSQPHRDLDIRKPADMNYIDREIVVQLHPDDAGNSGVNAGDRVLVKSESGHVLVQGVVSLDSPQKGLIGATTLFGELATKMHEVEYPDWTTQMPGLAYSRVTLELAPVEKGATVAAD